MANSNLKYDNWLNIQCSSQVTSGKLDHVYLTKGFEKDNLFLGRISENDYFIIINNIYPPNMLLFDNYKNFDFIYYDSVVFSSINTRSEIKKFLVISFSLVRLDLIVLFDALDDYCKRTTSKLFYDSDLRFFLNGLSDIVEKKQKRYSDILGCWGELFFIDFLISKNLYSVADILDSWESPGSRMLHDFKFCTNNFLFEVKTTTNDNNRIHEFMSLSQMTATVGFTGYLVSIKAIQDNIGGVSCWELQRKITSYFSHDLVLLARFNQLKIIRGEKLLNDEFFKFNTIGEEALRFISFLDVPKPDCPINVIDVSWSADCEALPTHLSAGLFV